MKRKIQERNTYVTLEQSFNEFIQQKEANGLSPATLRNYKLSYHIFFDYNEFDSETPITEINQNLINKWINHMRKERLKRLNWLPRTAQPQRMLTSSSLLTTALRIMKLLG